jgi:PAS domain S-box-containing protein/putative nucleotidyltransferase with HDIG domain
MSLVLVVYEEESEQDSIEKLLNAKGHSVLKARNGLEAIDIVRREHPDAALSDVVLPRMDGFALCRKWKQDDRLQTAPFIFYTTRFDDPKYERFAQEVGADRFFANPESTDAVITALDEALESSRRGTGTLRLKADDVVEAFEREKAREVERESEAARQRDAQRRIAIERQREAERERDKAVASLKGRVAELEATRQRHASAEAAYRALFDSAPVPMWIQDEETGKVVAVNEAALTRYGYARAEFLALDIRALQPGDDRPVTPTYDRPSPRRHRRKDKAFIEVELSVQALPWHGRRALYVVAHDVTDRLRALRALAEREELQRRVVASLPDAVLVTDVQGRITDVNETASGMTGRRRDELIGRNAGELLPAGFDAVSGTEPVRGVMSRAEIGDLEVEVRRAALSGDANRQLLVIRDVSRATAVDEPISRERDLEQRLSGLALLGDETSESELLRCVITDAVALTSSPAGYLHLLDRPKSALRLAAWLGAVQGEGAVLDGQPRSPARAGFFGQCAASRCPVMLNDPALRPQPDGLPALGRCIGVPLLEGDAVLAVLTVANRDADYTDEDRETLERYTAAAVRILARRRREVALTARIEGLARASESAIETLGAVAARLDPRGSHHSQRVAALAAALGRELGLDPTRIEQLETAGLLHDIGMAALPGGLVAVARTVDQDERTLIQRHPEVSASMLAGLDGGEALVAIVRQHHERLDGSGYPQGLSGDQIEMGARILAVADTVCGMMEHRAYRPAHSLEATLRELEKSAGRAFDPHVVAACVRLFRQQTFALPA